MRSNTPLAAVLTSTEPFLHQRPVGGASAPGSTASVPLSAAERDALYEEFQPLVKRLLRQYADVPDQREELVGEIYWRFCELLAAFDPKRGVPLRPYLVRSVTMSVYTFARSQWRKRGREVEIEVLGESAPLVSDDPTTEWDESLHLQTVVARLPEALQKLSERQRSIVIWRYYEGRSFEEIGELLGCQPATVRSLLRHGLNHLRRVMLPGVEEEE